MVEDGHLPNSYQYGSKTYYLDDVGRKSSAANDCRNNNDSCVVVIEGARCDGESSDGERTTTTTTTSVERNALKSPSNNNNNNNSNNNNHNKKTTTTNTSYSAASSAKVPNATTTTTTTVVVAATLPSAMLIDGVINTKSVTAPSPLRRFDDEVEVVRYGRADLNGSSHVDGHDGGGGGGGGAPSQNDYEVTKETMGNGEGGGGGGVLNDEQQPFGDESGGGPRSRRALLLAAAHLQEIHKTAIAFGLLIFNFFLTTTSLAIIHDRVPEEGPLPDLILGEIEPLEWALKVSEVLIIVTTSIMLAIIVLHKYRFVILRRLFLMLSLLYFMRSITMFVTVLPVSSRTYQCSEKKNVTELCEVMKRSLSLFFGMGLTINGRHVYCGDYIYSGHTTILVMSYLMISEYSSRRLVWLHWATWTMSLTGVLMVLLSHSHYTVDVIIGYYVTTRLFWMYHTCANNQLLKKRTAYNYLAREWWFGLFQYFECNVRGPLMPYEHR